MRRSLVLVVGVSLLAAACGRSAPGGALGRLVPLAGIVQLFQGDEWEPVTETTDLERGFRVRSGPTGGARIELSGKRLLELAPGSEVRVAPEPELISGSVLADAGPPLNVLVNQVTVEARNAVVRIDRDYSVRVAVYRGTALLPGSGWGVPLKSFQQIRVVAGTVNTGPQPLIVDPTNAWDLRLLGEAIDVGASLLRQERGLTSQLQGPGIHDVIIEALSGAIPSSDLGRILAATAPADVVIAALVASAIEGDPAINLQQILDLRTDGADWVVIAGRFGVPDTVLASITAVVGAIVDSMREGRRTAQTQRARSGGGGGGSGGGGSVTSAGGGGGGGGGGGNKGGKKGGDPPDDPEEPTCTDPVLCAVNDVIGDGLPGLG